jgi:hypothetical protein
MRTKLTDLVFNPESLGGLILRFWILGTLAGIVALLGATR